MGRYLWRAFAQRWNLLLFGAGAAVALLSPYPDVALPLVLGLEGAFLTGLVSRPRFREAVDAQDAARTRAQGERSSAQLFAQLHGRLTPNDRQRFERTVARCEDLRRLSRAVRPPTAAEDASREDALNTLLFFFLRLLVARRSLGQFLATSSRAELESQRRDVADRLAAHARQEQDAPGIDSRIAASLRDTLADLDARLGNLDKGTKDAEFMDLELARIEGKVHALAETAITSQDPGNLSAQVTAFTETLRLSQDVAAHMMSLDDLALATAEAPPILGGARVPQPHR